MITFLSTCDSSIVENNIAITKVKVLFIGEFYLLVGQDGNTLQGLSSNTNC